ncbi:hypothetical protein Lnau_0453 [Legionella nautarum]|uniref:Uncharacterized protein n=1 Tax=Legionella nautarum TaxID=45070 RepID=A0A0W0X241_9GAMM|nr:hypothetical protein [Legionella nautarum]KTD38643.1 hypothetical protein Lnau_0453 [Legionella nautarum]
MRDAKEVGRRVAHRFSRFFMWMGSSQTNERPQAEFQIGANEHDTINNENHLGYVDSSLLVSICGGLVCGGFASVILYRPG